MRTITAKELDEIKESPGVSAEEWISLGPTWCVVHKKFISHTTCNSFSASHKAGGWYCSWHEKME